MSKLGHRNVSPRNVSRPRSLSQEGDGQSEDVNLQLSVSRGRVSARAVPNSGKAIVMAQRLGLALVDVPAKAGPA